MPKSQKTTAKLFEESSSLQSSF